MIAAISVVMLAAFAEDMALGTIKLPVFYPVMKSRYQLRARSPYPSMRISEMKSPMLEGSRSFGTHVVQYLDDFQTELPIASRERMRTLSSPQEY